MSRDAVLVRLHLERERQRTLGVQYWPIVLRQTGDFAGCAGLRPFHDEPRVFELGVHIARAFWNQRLGEEAARAVIAFAFGTLGATALTAGHGPDHQASKALIFRLGFRFSHLEPWGAHKLDHPFYRLERSHYLAPGTSSLRQDRLSGR